jgi:hypothetical protein
MRTGGYDFDANLRQSVDDSLFARPLKRVMSLLEFPNGAATYASGVGKVFLRPIHQRTTSAAGGGDEARYTSDPFQSFWLKW